MRRIRLLPALALALAPALAAAQTPQTPAATGSPATQSTPAGAGSTQAAPATTTSGDGNTTSAPTTGGESSTTSAPAALPAAESAPASPSSSSGSTTAPGEGSANANTPHPAPLPENAESRTTPIVEIHGYLRSRFEWFYNFDLGWAALPTAGGGHSVVSDGLYTSSGLPWYRNPDWNAQYCFNDPGTGPLIAMPGSCTGNTQTSANMRLRLTPEIHPTEWMTIHSQIDVLDNLVLGSTPEGYYSGGTGSRSTWAPLTAFSQSQVAPTFGYNGWENSIQVRRAWAEVTNSTLGQIRFGRMPSHWGLGILANAGNGYDSDYQSTVDRVMYAARLRPLGLFLAAMWDFPSTGATSATVLNNEPGQGQPYDLSLLDDTHQWIVALGRRMDPDQQRTALSRGEWVVNGGAYLVYRTQAMSGEALNNPVNGTATIPGGSAYGSQLVPRNAQAFIGDLWLQVLRTNFRFEMEAVYIRGSLGSIDWAAPPHDLRYTIEQYGGALEMEYRLLNNRMKIEFRSGFASGDPQLEGLNYSNGLQPQLNSDHTLSLFRFHPDYRIDLIFWRQIMRQVSGAYYFRPSLTYNFIDEPNGDLFSGRVDVVWSRASEFIQTRGNHADLGVEIDATAMYQSNHRRPDGTEPPRPTPGFYGMLQYGVFFPLGGLQPTDQEHIAGRWMTFSAQPAQTIRGYLGVMF